MSRLGLLRCCFSSGALNAEVVGRREEGDSEFFHDEATANFAILAKASASNASTQAPRLPTAVVDGIMPASPVFAGTFSAFDTTASITEQTAGSRFAAPATALAGGMCLTSSPSLCMAAAVDTCHSGFSDCFFTGPISDEHSARVDTEPIHQELPSLDGISSSRPPLSVVIRFERAEAVPGDTEAGTQPQVGLRRHVHSSATSNTYGTADIEVSEQPATQPRLVLRRRLQGFSTTNLAGMAEAGILDSSGHMHSSATSTFCDTAGTRMLAGRRRLHGSAANNLCSLAEPSASFNERCVHGSAASNLSGMADPGVAGLWKRRLYSSGYKERYLPFSSPAMNLGNTNTLASWAYMGSKPGGSSWDNMRRQPPSSPSECMNGTPPFSSSSEYTEQKASAMAVKSSCSEVAQQLPAAMGAAPAAAGTGATAQFPAFEAQSLPILKLHPQALDIAAVAISSTFGAPEFAPSTEGGPCKPAVASAAAPAGGSLDCSDFHSGSLPWYKLPGEGAAADGSDALQSSMAVADDGCSARIVPGDSVASPSVSAPVAAPPGSPFVNDSLPSFPLHKPSSLTVAMPPAGSLVRGKSAPYRKQPRSEQLDTRCSSLRYLALAAERVQVPLLLMNHCQRQSPGSGHHVAPKPSYLPASGSFLDTRLERLIESGRQRYGVQPSAVQRQQYQSGTSANHLSSSHAAIGNKQVKRADAASTSTSHTDPFF